MISLAPCRFAELGYQGPFASTNTNSAGFKLKIVKRPPFAEGFDVVPESWVIEHPVGRNRRLAKGSLHQVTLWNLAIFVVICPKTGMVLEQLKPFGPILLFSMSMTDCPAWDFSGLAFAIRFRMLA